MERTMRSPFLQVPRTSIDGASPVNPANSPARGICIWGCRSDQGVIYVTMKVCLLGWAFLLYLRVKRHQAL